MAKSSSLFLLVLATIVVAVFSLANPQKPNTTPVPLDTPVKTEQISKFSVADNPPKFTNSDFVLLIPKLGLEEKIIDADPFKKTSYLPVISQNVAHANETKLPGENSLIYLFAHSSAYLFNGEKSKPIFANLSKLALGDMIELFYSGKFYTYEVKAIETVVETNLTPLTQTPKEETLVLQTCSGSNSRLIVTAQPTAQLALK